MKLFAILDVKSNSFMKVTCEKHTADAMRSFSIAANSKDTLFNRFPDDFALMEIGSFDPQTGTIEPLQHPQSLGAARTFLEVSSAVN